MNEIFLRVLTSIVAGSFFFGFFFISTFAFLLALVVVYAFILLIEWPRLCDTSTLRGAILSLFYPFFPMAALFLVCAQQASYSTIGALYPFLVAWVADTCAYVIGKNYGKTKVWPAISPGKSYEGLAGGLGGSFLLHMSFWLGGAHVPPIIAWWHWAILSVLMPLIAFAGDLFVSWLKRKGRIKDTGEVLPGHGGLLDRFDSVFFVAPAWLLILW